MKNQQYYHNKEEKALIKVFCTYHEIKCVKTQYRYFELAISPDQNQELKKLIYDYRIERRRAIRGSLGNFLVKTILN